MIIVKALYFLTHASLGVIVIVLIIALIAIFFDD